MSHQPDKYYDLEVLAGDTIYSAYELKARSFDQALKIMQVLCDETISKDSEVIYYREQTIH